MASELRIYFLTEKAKVKKLTVAEVREYALHFYNQGGDAIVECWDDKDIQEVLDECADGKDCLESFRCVMSVQEENWKAAEYFSDNWGMGFGKEC